MRNSISTILLMAAVFTIVAIAAWNASSRFNLKNRCKPYITYNENMATDHEIAFHELSYTMGVALEAEGTRLAVNEVIDIDGERLPIQSILGTKALVFFFYEGSCDVCLRDNLRAITSVQDSLPIILLCSFQDYRGFRGFVHAHRLNNIYMVDDKDNHANNDLYKNQLLHYFFIDNNMVMHKVFIPLQRHNNLTISYLKNAKGWL